MPAMKDAIAKLAIFTAVTFTPMPAADRSLARTASIAEPSALVRSRAMPSATRDEGEETQQSELDARERRGRYRRRD